MRNKLQETIKSKETETFKFVPNNKFYREVKISAKKFGAILRNEVQPDLLELDRLAKYFEVSYKELIDEHGKPEGAQIAEGLEKAYKEERRGRKKKATNQININQNFAQVA